MSNRVLSTEQARQSIARMQQIINGNLLEQIQSLNVEGQKLSDPNVWDGNLALRFRAEWPEVNAVLRRAQTQLEELRIQIAQINENIMRAGGNN